MNIVICGAGEVGSHAAEVLSAAGHNITVVDVHAERIESVEDSMDVRTLVGNSAHANVLLEAGVGKADLLIAGTDSDEVNLLTCAVARQVGAAKTIARVHRSAYLDRQIMDYGKLCGVDQMICPEYSTAQAIASVLRNPGALAIEHFARGHVHLSEVRVEPGVAVAGASLLQIKLPAGVRLAAVKRGHDAFVPDAQTTIEPGDVVVLVGNADVLNKALRLFRHNEPGRQRVAIMGGPSTAVWLCRQLHQRNFSLRLFEVDRLRAEELAAKLDWVTVLRADPTNPMVFDEERLDEIDAFVALAADSDEYNMLACAYAKSLGVKTTISVVQRPTYSRLVRPIGIDYAFTPRMMAMREIIGVMDDSVLQSLASLAEGVVNVYRARVTDRALVAHKKLRDVKLKPSWMIAAIQRSDHAVVPGPDDVLHPGDTVLVVGRQGEEGNLLKLFGG